MLTMSTLLLKKLTTWVFQLYAVVDTNSDPDGVDYIVPGNDDAIRASPIIPESLLHAAVADRRNKDVAAVAEQDGFVEAE